MHRTDTHAHAHAHSYARGEIYVAALFSAYFLYCLDEHRTHQKQQQRKKSI